jgi:hypothetical protein
MALPKHFEAIENHLDKFIKTDDEIIVFDEKKSNDFHLDVYWIKSNKIRNYTILMTNGISSVPLKTPDKIFSPYIELCILLPKNWNLKNDDWKKPENYWPIALLKNLGRYPSENNTWLGYGHTIPNTEPIVGTDFIGTILIKSKTLQDEFQSIKYEKETIELYALFPFYSNTTKYIST